MPGTVEMPTTPIEENKVEVREETTTPESAKTVETNESEQKNAEALQEAGKQALQFQTAVETNATKNEVLTQLLDIEERMQEAESRISSLSSSIRPQNWEVHLSPEQISEISRVDELFSSVKVGLKPEALRHLMLQSPTFLDDFIKNIEKDTKLEKKKKKQLKKAAKKLQKNLEAKHENNYYFDQILAFSRLREDLETGEYKTTKFAVLKHNPLFVDIYKNRKKLAQSGAIQLTIDGKNIDVYNQANLKDAKTALGNFINYNQPRNVAEKWITENTKMSLSQARNMLGMAGTIWVVWGLFMLGKRLFTKTDEKWNTKFDFSFGKLATLIGVPLALDYGSQMASGKGILTHLEKRWKTGEFPRDEHTENATPVENLAIQQVQGQFALLGVPYASLQQCVKFNNGIATEIDVNQLLNYYQWALESARARKDGAAEKQIGMQIEAVKSMLNNENAKRKLNEALLNLNLAEDQIKNPANAQLTLNEKLSENNERVKQLEYYLKNKNLRIEPSKSTELNTKLFTTEKALEESDFDKLFEEGFFVPAGEVYQELEKISALPKREKMQMYQAFEKLKKVPDYQAMQLELSADNKLKISSNGSSLLIDPVKRTLEGLKNGGAELPFESQEDLIRTALLVNSLREEKNLWKESPDTERTTEKNWPFDFGNQLTKSIYFKKHGGEEVNVISDLVPFLSEMDRKFPTIEAEENRAFFVNYLNELWAKDHQVPPTS